MNIASTTTEQARHPGGSGRDAEFEELRRKIGDRLKESLKKGPLFRTDTKDLFLIYLAFLPHEHRQYHNCHCCRRFIEEYGGLVVIDEEGNATPALWSALDASDYYEESVAALARAASSAKVTGVFVSSKAEWGQNATGPWTHLAITPPASCVHKKPGLATLADSQAEAAKLEEYGMVQRALGDFRLSTLDKAIQVLESDAVSRSEKIVGPVKWLRDLQSNPKNRRNRVWRAVATAPPGFCHIRQSVAATLLEDIESGMAFPLVKSRFDAKMSPLRYQRPQSAPTEGNIARAEKIVAEMGIAPSLKRRFATLDEIQSIWRLKSAVKPEDGVFSHLTPKGRVADSVLILPPTPITLEKFRRDVLPRADRIRYRVPYGNGPYAAMLTASDPDAPPIFQWDSYDNRIPVTYYTYINGSEPRQFSLNPGQYVDVLAVALPPYDWDEEGKFSHLPQAAFFILEGAKDTRKQGLALFPEFLRSELREVRSTIEAYSNQGMKDDAEGQHAAGLLYGKSQIGGLDLRVESGGIAIDYKIDRWD